MAKQTNRTPGRPVASEREGQEARETLVQTAARLFAEQGYEGTSLRQVAEGAGVTPAMVAYYFRDKSGLLEAVVREGLGIMLGVVRCAVDEHPEGGFVEHLVQGFMTALSATPWVPRIMIREVISRDTPLRDLFVREFAVHAVTLVPAKVAAEMDSGKLRADLDPRFAVISLVGMCLFPFISLPVVGPLLNIELNEDFAAAYGTHVLDLFTHGAGTDR